MDFYSLKLIEKKQLISDAYTFKFEVPEDLKKKFQFKPGQYLTLKFDINGSEERRSYSLCSSPEDGEWTVAVKKVDGGKVSTYMIEKLSEGQSVEMAAPEGKFVAKTNDEQSKSYYLFGAGSGITPLMSILRSVLEKEPLSTVFLLYGNRNEDTIIFQNELEKLQQKFSGQLIIEHTLSRPKKEKGGWFKKEKISWQGKIGRISDQSVRMFLAEHPARSKAEEYFICGPGGMIKAAEGALLDLGIEKKYIHHEYFASVEEGESNISVAEAMDSFAKIHLDGVDIEVTISKGTNVIDALTEEGYDPPYSCKSGTCSTCIAKLKSGKVEMETCLALDDDEITEGYILACQACPTTPEVEITFEV